jgi:hypothetical protein
MLTSLKTIKVLLKFSLIESLLLKILDFIKPWLYCSGQSKQARDLFLSKEV